MYNLAIRGHDIVDVNTVEELAERMQSYGIKNIQLALSKSFPKINITKELNPGMATYFKNVFADAQIQIALLSCYSNLIHPEMDQRKEIIENFKNHLFYARYFQASMVASETGSVLPEMGYSEENFKDKTFNDLISVIKELVLEGEKQRMMVGIEAGLNHPLYSNKRIIQLINEIPSNYLGIIYDPTNLVDANNYSSIVELVESAFKTFGDKIVCFHLKDFIIDKGEIKPVPLGDGLIPFDQILEIISKYRPYCYIVLEETKNEKIKKAVEFLNN